MVKLKNEVEYNWAMARIEELLPFVTDETPEDDAMYIELNVLSDLVSDYEEIHYNVENLIIKDGIVVEKKKNFFDRHKKSFNLRTTLPRKKKKWNAYSSALKKSAGNKLTFSLAK